jgi:integrase
VLDDDKMLREVSLVTNKKVIEVDVRAVVASAVSSEGEQLYPRNWDFHLVGLPVVNEKKQCKPSLTTNEVEQILERTKGRYKVLFVLLAGTGLRIGEARGLKLGDHLSGDLSTIKVRQSEAPSRLPRQTMPSGKLIYLLLWQRS